MLLERLEHLVHGTKQIGFNRISSSLQHLAIDGVGLSSNPLNKTFAHKTISRSKVKPKYERDFRFL